MKRLGRKKVTKSKKRKTKQRRQRGKGFFSGFDPKNIAEAIKEPMKKVFMDLVKWHKENKK
jgi:hypothetical protein